MSGYKVRFLEHQYGDLKQVIPDLVNRYGQWEAGRRLGISQATVSRWLKQNGYVMKVVFVPQEPQERAS